MHYRLFTAFLFSTLFLLLGCDNRVEPAKVSRLDNQVMSNLVNRIETLVNDRNFAEYKGVFSPAVEVTYISPNGHEYQADYRYIQKQADLFLQYGRGYSSELLDEVILIASDQRSATVEQRKKETWLFHAPYNDIAFLSVQRMDWQLEGGIPQVVKMTRTILDRTTLVDKNAGQSMMLWKSET